MKGFIFKRDGVFIVAIRDNANQIVTVNDEDDATVFGWEDANRIRLLLPAMHRGIWSMIEVGRPPQVPLADDVEEVDRQRGRTPSRRGF